MAQNESNFSSDDGDHGASSSSSCSFTSVMDILHDDDMEFYLSVISFLAVEELLQGDDLQVLKELQLEERRLNARIGVPGSV